ncbi:MAG: LuxR C-terminal-related transcriptional regulator [Planctomycetaceae bacterium]
MTTSDSADHLYSALREAAENLLAKSLDSFKPNVGESNSSLLDSQIILKSINHEVVYLSPELKSRFFADDDLASINESKILHDLEADLIGNADRLSLEHSQSLTLTFRATDVGGREVRLFSHRVPLHGPDNQVLGILGSYVEMPSLSDQQEQGRSAMDLNALAATFDSLDDRDREMAKLLSRGAINKQLAGHFNVSIRSIENWRRALLNKLGAETIADLTRLVVRFEDFGLMPPPNTDG